MKVHGDLQGHRTKAELAKRATPMQKPPTRYLLQLAFASKRDRDEFNSWLDKFFDENRAECVCAPNDEDFEADVREGIS
jgi:hypothetical protein